MQMNYSPLLMKLLKPMSVLRPLFVLILTFTLSGPATAQSKADTAAILKNMLMQADTVGNLFINKEIDKFVAKMDPRLLKAIGGEEKMHEALQKIYDDLSNDSIAFTHASFSKPSAIVMSGKEMQCTLHEDIEMKTPDTVKTINALMLAMSQDKGKHWTFVDVPKGDLENLRAIFPNISDKLKHKGQYGVKKKE